MNNLTYELSRARIDDQRREADDRRRASGRPGQLRSVPAAATTRRRLTGRLRTLRRIVWPAAQRSNPLSTTAGRAGEGA
jgi:hypothetical protein